MIEGYPVDQIRDIFSKHLSIDGLGVTDHATGNYAVPTNFELRPAASEKFVVARMIFFLVDTGTLDSSRYGNALVLTNGLKISKSNGAGVLIDLTNANPIITNADYGHHCYDVQVLNFGVGDESLAARWSFFKHGQPGIELNGADGEVLRVTLEDNFTGLIGHAFIAQGYIP